MLKILDRYILGKYLATFFFVVMIFTLLGVVIDYSENVDKFNDPIADTGEVASTAEVVWYYTTFMVFINGVLFPIFALISVIFFTSRLAFNSEIISILNAGVSFRRFLRPYMLGAGALFLLHLSLNHLVIPLTNKYKISFERKYIFRHSDQGKTEDVHMFIAPDTKVFVWSYNKRDSAAKNLRIEHFKDGSIDAVLKTDRAEWDGKKKKWHLTNWEVRTFDGMKETRVNHVNQPIDTAINLHPDDFSFFENQKDLLTFSELQEYIDRETLRGAGNTKLYEVEKYRRYADAITILILTLMGVALAARKVRGGIGLHLALGLVLGAVYIFLSKFSITFAATSDLPSWLSISFPNIVFGTLAAFLLSRSQK